MKNLTVLCCLFLLMHAGVYAQDSPYQAAMKKEIATLTTADSLPQLRQSVNAFARIAALNPGEWQPLYYGALACTYQGLAASLSLDKKDAWLAQAWDLVNKAAAISPDNSEIVAMQGFVTMAKLSADPGSRGQSLSPVALQFFGRAIALDENNPRALALMAQMEWGIAQFFGSSTEKACVLASRSRALFAAQDNEALKAALKPAWGSHLAEKVMQHCK
ncbi:hypothetical protein [Dyadobacter sandarakinus]|uniref:Uncharacterized protein n=1 Tax=Dyadobacter sandarakinus TaxID=2747268 RepID=A0ABX7I7F8_9BACT|nr:hypothetical protein [Dyadobacter sandarakinus]QRR02041.1 hypothetical protein HWI92_14555 [Dyadobacter sandarakinus]